MSLEDLTFKEKLNEDIYVTYKGYYKNNKVIIKLFTDLSDKNNEFEILQYLNKKETINKYPKPYIQLPIDGMISINKTFSCYVSKIIVYEYIEGKEIKLYSMTKEEKKQCKLEIASYLSELHQLNIIYNDVRFPNILINDSKYYLIDYGCSFSDTMSKFPPMEYLLEDVPTKKDDFRYLDNIFG